MKCEGMAGEGEKGGERRQGGEEERKRRGEREGRGKICRFEYMKVGVILCESFE